MMVLPLLLIMILPKVMNDPEARRVSRICLNNEFILLIYIQIEVFLAAV